MGIHRCERCNSIIEGKESIVQLYIPFPLGIRVEGHTNWELCNNCTEFLLDFLQQKLEPCEGKHASNNVNLDI